MLRIGRWSSAAGLKNRTYEQRLTNPLSVPAPACAQDKGLAAAASKLPSFTMPSPRPSAASSGDRPSQKLAMLVPKGAWQGCCVRARFSCRPCTPRTRLCCVVSFGAHRSLPKLVVILFSMLLHLQPVPILGIIALCQPQTPHDRLCSERQSAKVHRYPPHGFQRLHHSLPIALRRWRK